MSSVPSPFAVERAMSEAMQLRAELTADDQTIADDDRLLCDVLDGETDVFAVLDRLIENSMADGVLAEMAAARAKRLEARKAQLRDVAMRMLEALEVKSVERAAYTASISHRTKAILTDALQLPEAFFRHSPDMVAVAKALKAGPVPGATLSNAIPTLTVRVR